MKKIETAIQINASPEAVWNVLVNFSRMDWNPLFASIEGAPRRQQGTPGDLPKAPPHDSPAHHGARARTGARVARLAGASVSLREPTSVRAE